MNEGQQAEPSGTLPSGKVEAAGGKLWETHSAGSVLTSQSDGKNSGLIQVWFGSMSRSSKF